MKPSLWQVLIADMVSSRRIPAGQRSRVDRALNRAVRHTVRTFGDHFRLRPQVLRGDELQAVLRQGAPALSILTYLRARFAIETGPTPTLRAGLGTGRVSRMSPRGPFASDGEAFHRARAALASLSGTRAWRFTAWDTGHAESDRWTDGILALVDAIMGRWTGAQWEAIAGRLETKGLHDIARARGVSFQSVSKRLRAASWNEVQQAVGLLESVTSGSRARPWASRTPRREGSTSRG